MRPSAEAASRRGYASPTGHSCVGTSMSFRPTLAASGRDPITRRFATSQDFSWLWVVATKRTPFWCGSNATAAARRIGSVELEFSPGRQRCALPPATKAAKVPSELMLAEVMFSAAGRFVGFSGLGVPDGDPREVRAEQAASVGAETQHHAGADRREAPERLAVGQPDAECRPGPDGWEPSTAMVPSGAATAICPDTPNAVRNGSMSAASGPSSGCVPWRLSDPGSADSAGIQQVGSVLRRRARSGPRGRRVRCRSERSIHPRRGARSGMLIEGAHRIGAVLARTPSAWFAESGARGATVRMRPPRRCQISSRSGCGPLDQAGLGRRAARGGRRHRPTPPRR